MDYTLSPTSESLIGNGTVGVRTCSNFSALVDMTTEQSIETVTITLSLFAYNERADLGQRTATLFIRDIDCE